MREAVIIDAVRTPFGRYGGALRDVRPDDLGAHVIGALLARTGVDPALVDDVILGCANQAGEDNRNVARMSLLLAGMPESVPGVTVNRLCASGLEAVNLAARAIRAGEGDVFIAGGVESMTRAPLVMAKPNQAFPRGSAELYDTTLGWRFTNPRLAERHTPYSMGETAENVAQRYGITREEQDRFALRSQQLALRADFSGEIAPIAGIRRDEHPRPDTTMEALAKLKPAFRTEGTVTAGNAAGVNDGAAALLVMSREKALALGLKPLARYVASAVVGVNPAVMGIGPVGAVRKALQAAGLAVSEIDRWELNEAFAAQAIACIRELRLELEKVNPQGGAIALGHPLGASGARLAGTLVHALRNMDRYGHRYGVAAMCVGVGQGVATVFERE